VAEPRGAINATTPLWTLLFALSARTQRSASASQTAGLALGIIGTGLAYVLNYRIITDEGPTLASTVTYLLPVVAGLLGFVVLGEPVTVQMAAGVAIVLVGIALTRRSPTGRN
jgi:drug/metabolite transporter (DMT)-like permease